MERGMVGGEDGKQAGAAGTVISSTPSVDVDMLEGQDQETVAGSGTHLDGTVDKVRNKMRNKNDSKKLTVDVIMLQGGCVTVDPL
jgi:hypothetical protein